MTVEPVENVTLEPQPAAVVRGRVRPAEIPEFLGRAFADTMAAISRQGLTAAGPPFARYRMEGDGFDIEAGFPATGVVEDADGVICVELGGGPAARVLYRGDYSGVSSAYEALEAWLAAHGYTPSADAWETYLDEPDVPEPRTVVHQPYAQS
jgi:effector-binding domain-containing protein